MNNTFLRYLTVSSILITKAYAQPAISSVSVPVSLLTRHVYALTDDSFSGRETGTVGQLKAAQYCVQSFRASHLGSVFRVDSAYGSFYQPYFLSYSTISLVKTERGTLPLTYKRYELAPSPVTQWDSSQVVAGHNVAGLLIGTDLKQEVVVISAHYDHLGYVDGRVHPGADDNASGTASVLSIASVFDSLARQGIRSRRTILFALFSGEEKGLLGSRYFVNNSPIPVQQFVGNLNIDMVGRIDYKHRKKPEYCYLIAGPKDDQLRKLVSAANKRSVAIELDYEHDSMNDSKQYFYRSDQYNFHNFGVPAVFFTDGEHPDYHRPTDTADRIDYQILAKRATLVLQTAWLVANPDS